MSRPTRIQGRALRENMRVKTWFMPGGTPVLTIEPYRGPLQHLWPAGALIVGFAALTKSGVLPMTVGNDDDLEIA